MPVSIGQAPHKTISSKTLFDLKRKHDFGDSIIDSIAAACKKDLGNEAFEGHGEKLSQVIRACAFRIHLVCKICKPNFEY